MRHAVFMLMYNTTEAQLELSKLALDSILLQDIGPLDIFVVNNGSTDETKTWLNSLIPSINVAHYPVNRSPLKIANDFSKTIFTQHDKILGVPSDVILPSSCYRLMNEWPRGFVSATPIEDVPQFQPVATSARAISECTPMAIMLTRKWAYDAIVAKDGYFFDERFEHYASDNDLALRMAACGIRGVQLDIPVWHYRSASHRLAAPGIGKSITDKADADRRKFIEKWGFAVDSPQYGASAADINFKG